MLFLLLVRHALNIETVNILHTEILKLSAINRMWSFSKDIKETTMSLSCFLLRVILHLNATMTPNAICWIFGTFGI